MSRGISAIKDSQETRAKSGEAAVTDARRASVAIEALAETATGSGDTRFAGGRREL